MMTKLNVYLVRHGQTYYNIYNKLQGWSNSPLTDKGKRDAVTAGEKVQDIHFNAAFCSDTGRAEETLKKILEINKAGTNVTPVFSPYLREQFYGSWEGVNMDYAWEMAGMPHGYKTFKDIVTAHSIATAKDYLHDADPFRDAENNEMYWKRVNKGIDLIKDADLPSDSNVLWVSHGNTLLSLIERFGNGKYDVTKRPANGSLTKLIFDGDDVKVDFYNK